MHVELQAVKIKNTDMPQVKTWDYIPCRHDQLKFYFTQSMVLEKEP